MEGFHDIGGLQVPVNTQAMGGHVLPNSPNNILAPFISSHGLSMHRILFTFDRKLCLMFIWLEVVIF